MTLADIKHTWESLDPIKPHLDVAAVGSFVLALLGWLPGLMTAATTATTLVWSCIRLYETQTVQNWLARRRAAKEALK
jgi:FtsH-binding integral membrane protein